MGRSADEVLQHFLPKRIVPQMLAHLERSTPREVDVVRCAQKEEGAAGGRALATPASDSPASQHAPLKMHTPMYDARTTEVPSSVS
jgi:hypothetical protein